MFYSYYCNIELISNKNKMLEQPVENKITLRSVFKFPKAYIEPAIDPVTNRYAPNVRKVDSHGNMVVSDSDKSSGEILIGEDEVIEIFDGKVFDLDDPYDKAWWEAIKHCKRIAQERWKRNAKGELVIDGNVLRYGSAEFYIEKAGQASKQKVDSRKAKHEAEQYIFNDTKDGLYQKVRLLGNPMSTLPIAEVEEFLLDMASKTPDKIKTLYTGEDTHLRLLLLDALDKSVIRFKDKLYQYGDSQILGASQEAVILWFKNPVNMRLKDFIKQETYPEFYGDVEVDVNYNLPTEEITAATNRGKPSPKK